MKIITKNDVKNQYNELLNIVNDRITFEQIKEIIPKVNEIEINYFNINSYEGESIEVVRYDYKDILVYFDIINGELVPREDYITIYDSYGTERFEGEIEDFISCEYE